MYADNVNLHNSILDRAESRTVRKAFPFLHPVHRLPFALRRLGTLSHREDIP
jgi:hypothetical protein